MIGSRKINSKSDDTEADNEADKMVPINGEVEFR